MITDYLGEKIKIGSRAVMCMKRGHSTFFQKVKVLDIDEGRRYGDKIRVIADQNERGGWTYANRLIMNNNFVSKL